MSSFKITGAVGGLGQSVTESSAESQFDPTAVSIPTIIPAEQIIAQQQATQHTVDPAAAAGFVRPRADTAKYVHSSVKSFDGNSLQGQFAESHTSNNETRSVEYGDPVDALLHNQTLEAHQHQEAVAQQVQRPSVQPAIQPQAQLLVQQQQAPRPIVEQAEAVNRSVYEIPTPKAAELPREASLCDTDSRYHDLTDNLPTQFVFYPFDRLSVRPLQLADHIKLGSGSKVGSARTICEGIGATIDRDWLNLAFADFIFIAFWLRVNSYQENQYSLTWICEGREHNRKVFLGELPEDTLKNTSTITKADVKVNSIDFEVVEPLAQLLSEKGIFITAPTVRDFLFFVEHGSELPDDIAFYIDAASVLSPAHGKTVRDRVDFLINMVNTRPEAESMEVLQILNEVSGIVSNCGVRQAFDVVCSHCGEKGVKEVEIDLLTFFPFGK